jgi:hypothetical protein
MEELHWKILGLLGEEYENICYYSDSLERL